MGLLRSCSATLGAAAPTGADQMVVSAFKGRLQRSLKSLSIFFGLPFIDRWP